MPQKNFLIISYLFFLALVSCKTASLTEKADKAGDPKKISEEKNIKSAEKINDRPVSGNANAEAKITATVISIDPARDSSDTNSPCFKAPCYAGIRIEKIERKGSLFHVPGSSEITVFFTYTLHPTDKNLFPGSEKSYPGLKINDKFEAVIDSRPSINEGTRYAVYDYKKIE